MICITLRNFTEISDTSKTLTLGSMMSSLLCLTLENFHHKHVTLKFDMWKI